MFGITDNSFFLETALKSSVLLLVAWFTVFLLRKKSAAIHHLIWSGALAALLTLPLLSLSLPSLRMPLLGSAQVARLVFQADAQARAQEPTGISSREAINSHIAKPAASPMAWVNLPFILWVAGAAISFAQMFIGWVFMERLRRRAKLRPEPELASLAKLLDLHGRVDAFEIPAGSMPVTYGIFRPGVFLPADAAEWNAERRRSVLLHELAHVRRGDAATQWMARAALAVYWWNPLAWKAWREFLKEREKAADDLVLSAGASPSDYASDLFEIARSMQSSSAYGWAAVSIARKSQLEGRLLAILDSQRDRTASRQSFALAALLGAIMVVSPVAALRASNTGTQGLPTTESIAADSLKNADQARDLGKFDQAKVLYQKALLSARGPGAAAVLIRLGTVELETKNFAPAIHDFEQAHLVDSTRTAEARMWTAIAQQRQNNLDVADAQYLSALTAVDPHSSLAATILELRSVLLQEQNLPAEADSVRRQAYGLREELAAKVKQVASSPDVHQIGVDTRAPTLLSKVEPKYTAEARIAHYAGSALLSIEVGTDGQPRNVRVIRDLGFGLDQKAIEAISQWKFKPGTIGGQPVKVSARVEINFRLL